VLSSLSRDNKLIFWSLALWGVGEGLWWYLLSVYIESLGANSVQIGFVLSVAMILMTALFIPSGWITDRLSRRLIMITGWFMGLIAILVVAMAHSWQQAIPGLLLYNLSAFNMPAINSYITAEVKSGDDMRRVFTTTFSGFTLGMMFSPALGGWLADMWGLRNLFFMAAVFYAMSTALILLIREQPIHRASFSSAQSPLGYNRSFIYLCLVLFVAHLVGHLGIPLAPNFLRDIRQLNMGAIGTLGSINSLGSFLLIVLLGRWPRSRTGGLLLAEATVAAYSVIMLTASAFPWLGLALFLRGGLGALRQLGAARLGELMPAASMGLGFGIFQTAVNLAFTISPYVAGWLYAFDPRYPFVASVVLTLPTMIVTMAAGRQAQAAEAPVAHARTASD